jgi:hypothetical protein
VPPSKAKTGTPEQSGLFQDNMHRHAAEQTGHSSFRAKRFEKLRRLQQAHDSLRYPTGEVHAAGGANLQSEISGLSRED